MRQKLLRNLASILYFCGTLIIVATIIFTLTSTTGQITFSPDTGDFTKSVDTFVPSIVFNTTLIPTFTTCKTCGLISITSFSLTLTNTA